MVTTTRTAVAAALLAMGVVVGGCVPPPAPDPVDPGQCQVERRTIKTAVEAARAETGSYPVSLDSLFGTWIDPDGIVLDWHYELTADGYLLEGPC